MQYVTHIDPFWILSQHLNKKVTCFVVRYYWLPKEDQKNIAEPKFQIIKLFIIISISFADSSGVCPKGQIFHLFSFHYSRLTHLLNIGFLVIFIRLNHNTCNVKTLVPLVLYFIIIHTSWVAHNFFQLSLIDGQCGVISHL